MIFQGDDFAHNEVFGDIRNIMLDLFRGADVSAINLKGLTSVVVFTAIDGNLIHVRNYAIILKKSGQKVAEHLAVRQVML